KRSRGRKDDGDKQKTQAELLIDLASDAVLFHDSEHRGYAEITVEGTDDVPQHVEVHPIRSKRFKEWLQQCYYHLHDKVASTQALQDAVDYLEGRAKFTGAEKNVAVRVAGDHDRIYIDLGTPAWSVVEITADGWRVIDRSPIPFIRPRGLKAL